MSARAETSERSAAKPGPGQAGLQADGSAIALYEDVAACPFCGSAGRTEIMRKTRNAVNGARFTPGRIGGQITVFSAARCDACGLVYQSPRPPESTLLRIIDEGYPIREPNERLRRLFAEDLRILSKHAAPGGRLLDIGCNAGFFLDLARDRYEVHGCDPCGPAVRYANEKLGLEHVIRGTIEAWPAREGGGFDAITSIDTFEHMYDPAEFVARVYERLNPGGVFFVRTLRRDGVNARLTGTDWHGFTTWHLIFPTAREVADVCEKAGLKTEKIHIGRSGPGEAWASLKHHGKMVGGKWLPVPAWKQYRARAGDWARHWSFFRDEFVLIARRPA